MKDRIAWRYAYNILSTLHWKHTEGEMLLHVMDQQFFLELFFSFLEMIPH